jgi:hypothetical protein
MWASLRCGVVTGCRPVSGNLTGVATRASRGGVDLREERADMRAPFVSDGSTVMGWQVSSHVKMGWGRSQVGLAAEKATHNDFSNLNPFSN